MSDVLTQLRHACAAVAQQARHVVVNREAIPAYAAALPLGAPTFEGDSDRAADPPVDPPVKPPLHHTAGSAEELAAYWLTLDAINFGSGWFPTLRKRPGESGYHTIAAGITNHFAADGPWSAAQLQGITAEQMADVLDQEPAHELMGLFARSLADLGHHVAHEHQGRFEAVVDAAMGSAANLVEHLARWDCFTDLSTYKSLTIPFLKRAQIAAADLARAKVARFEDLDRLTMFADNLVPHVLRLDGILTFEPDLLREIEREQLIEHGSPAEVEIRACAVHAVELIVSERPEAKAAEIDQLLWLRGQQPRYKASPRHRSRCTAY